MPNPREVSDVEREAIWAEVRAEFPEDEMMREIHSCAHCALLNSAILPATSAWSI